MKLVNQQSSKLYLVMIGISGFLAVAVGAFGAHALKGIIPPERMVIFETGNKYHFYHTIMSLIAIYFSEFTDNRIWKWASGFFLIGIVFFSFSLYALAITGIKILGAITPFGGVCFLVGWAFILFASIQSRNVP